MKAMTTYFAKKPSNPKAVSTARPKVIRTKRVLNRTEKQQERMCLIVSCQRELARRLEMWRAPVTGLPPVHGGTKPIYFQSKLQRTRTNHLLVFYNRLAKGEGTKSASKEAATAWSRSVSYYARQLRRWARVFEKTGQLPASMQGAHGKTLSLLDEPDIRIAMQTFLRSNKWAMDPGKLALFMKGDLPKIISDNYAREIANNEMPDGLARFLREDIFPKIGLSLIKPPTIRTMRRWMILEGFRWESFKKNKYIDGHDRDDVLQYRKDTFLPLLIKWRPRINEWENDQQHVNKPVVAGKSRLVTVFHDESVFHSNDGQRMSWVPNGQHKLRPKGQGRGLHRSDFICSTHGWLKEAGEELHIGKNHGGYWTGEDIAKQIPKAVANFEKLHGPGVQGIFIFDNSSGHSAYAADALRAGNMNANPGGKQSLLRDGWYIKTSADGTREKVQQTMVDEAGVAKGLKRVLQERGEVAASNLKAKCAKADDHREDKRCCMQAFMDSQPDFVEAARRPLIREIVEQLGHKCLFLPKFHCELNIIEFFWGAAKRYTRENCQYKWDELVKIVPEALEQVSITTIRRWDMRFWRYVDQYIAGKSCVEADIAVRAYTSHRRATERQI